MGKEIELYLVPAPGQKPEFLAKIAPVDPSQAVVKLWDAVVAQLSASSSLSSESHPLPRIVLEAYTRDGWAWKPNQQLQMLTVQSLDGRNKLPGFLDYLKGRQKSAYGRFAKTALCIVPFAQSSSKEKNRMTLSLTLDLTKVEHCGLQPLTVVPKPSSSAPPPTAAGAAPPRRAGGGGLLGKLVGAQQRTNQHMAVATAKTASSSTTAATAAATRIASSSSSSSNGTTPATTSTAVVPEEPPRTAQQVLADFRQSMQNKMLDFDIADEDKLEIKLSLVEHQKGLSTEDKTRVTMEILKYLVYEAAEEVNEEWIAHKEPSEFMDEVVISVYKEGAAPLEVIEEMNKGELPDEIRGQQRALATERQRQVQIAESRNQERMMQQAHREIFDEDEEAVEALNTKKRDRRTIEDYEREKREQAKRGRS